MAAQLVGPVSLEWIRIPSDMSGQANSIKIRCVWSGKFLISNSKISGYGWTGPSTDRSLCNFGGAKSRNPPSSLGGGGKLNEENQFLYSCTCSFKFFLFSIFPCLQTCTSISVTTWKQESTIPPCYNFPFEPILSHRTQDPFVALV